MTDSATTTLSVPEISCGHCKSTIEAAVQGLGDVARVEVDIDAKTVTIDGGDRDHELEAANHSGRSITGQRRAPGDERRGDRKCAEGE